MSFFQLTVIATLTSLALSEPVPLRIDGLVAATFSPFDAHGRLNISAVPAQAAYLAETGVEWVFVTGTTGESLSLTVQERKDLFTAWINTSANVIAHVGAESIEDARNLAKFASAQGAKAIGAMPPVFFKPADVTALALTMAAVCSAAPDLPCYYYHIPSMTGVVFPMLDLIKAIEPLSPNFAGIKYTGLYTYPGFMDAQRCMAYKDGKYEVLSGREDMMLEALSIGVKGHVGSQFNFAGDLFNTIREDFAKEGLTKASSTSLRAQQLHAADLIDAWKSAAPAGVNGAKYFMNLAGRNRGLSVGPPRLPSIPVGNAAKALDGAFATFCSEKKSSSLIMCK